MSSYDRVAAAFHTRIDAIVSAVDAMAPGIERSATLLVQAALGDHKVLICASGQDDPLANHTAAALREAQAGMPPLPAYAITSDVDPAASGNLERDLRALSRDGDVLLAIDTSADADLARFCVEVAQERNLGLIILSVSEDAGIESAIPLPGETQALRMELAMMAVDCLHTEIRHLLLGE
jgi:phosphoheptose isomerase